MIAKRESVLRSDGIDPEKIKQIADETFMNFCYRGLSIKEAEEVVSELGCILKRIKCHVLNRSREAYVLDEDEKKEIEKAVPDAKSSVGTGNSDTALNRFI